MKYLSPLLYSLAAFFFVAWVALEVYVGFLRAMKSLITGEL